MPSFLENILSIESPDATVHDPDANRKDYPAMGETMSHQTPTGSENRKPNSDFSSLWNYAKLSGPVDLKGTTHTPESTTGAERRPSSSFALNPVLMDKLMERFLTMALPVDDNEGHALLALADRIEMQKSRPSLLVNIMARNSVLLLQRLLCPFVFIDKCIIFFDWKEPSFTIGVLLIITHIVLRPSLLCILPAIAILYGVMTPNYLTIYEPDQSYVPDILEYNPMPSLTPVCKAKVPEPIPQISREFLLNLTDLQNHMLIYVATYDFLVWITEDYLFFKDEQVSVIVFITLLTSAISTIVCSQMIYSIFTKYIGLIKLIVAALIWGFTIVMHPSFRGPIISKAHNEETRLYFLHISNAIEQRISKYVDAQHITSKCARPEREVRIFELQKFNSQSKSWDSIGYSSSYYTVNTALRKSYVKSQEEATYAELASNITEAEPPSLIKKYLLLDIKPPKDYVYVGDWHIELNAEQWVEENFLEGLVTIDEGEKWVYDAPDTILKQTEKGESVKADIFRRRSWLRGCRHVNLNDKFESD